MQAQTREQYTKAWTHHVMQMRIMYIEAGMPLEAWSMFEVEQRALIDRAATTVYGPPEDTSGPVVSPNDPPMSSID